jgi:hypothetical protein
MSDWSSLKINIDPLGKLKPPLQSLLTVLESVEAILEALLALIKVFSLDLLNPLRAIIALLLASIRAIINQIKSTGFAVLLVRPDFRRSDLRAVFNSVSGGYKGFEAKVIGKFYDETDPFRPQYTAGMNAMMSILYIGAESPADLLSEVIALLDLIKHPMDDVGLAAPVDLKVSTPTQNGGPATQFWQLYQKVTGTTTPKLVLEWKMPTSAAGIGSPTLVGQIAASLPSYNLGQKFIIERTDATHPTGEYVYAKFDSKTQGTRVARMAAKYNIPSVSTKIAVKERGGGAYKFFRTRRKADNITYLGGVTGTYRYIDTDVEEGKIYYYRVRTYMGKLNDLYVRNDYITTPDDARENFVKQDSQYGWVVNYGKNVVMGKPSATVKGFVPLSMSDSDIFDLYKDLLNSVLAALLLNFELPYPTADDNSTVIYQKTGWGTLSVIAGQIGVIKYDNNTSDSFVKFPFLKPTIRRIVNPIVEKIRTKPQLMMRLGKLWAAGVKGTVEKILGAVGYEFTVAGMGGVKSYSPDNQTTGTVKSHWGLFGVLGDVTDKTNEEILSYLEKENPRYAEIPGKAYDGPLPLLPGPASAGISVSVDERNDLADFLRLALSIGPVNYLQWYSVTIGDLFPAIVPFLYDFEQWILALLKAIESALKEITDIIETLIQRIRDLEQLVRAIIALIEMLNIEVSVSSLWVSGTDGVNSLIQGLMDSQNKPGDKPFGLHSGLIMTAGGPGPGFTKALEALKFLLTVGSK